MDIIEARQRLSEYEHTQAALAHASGLVYYDGVTGAPKTSAQIRPNTLGELSRISYELTTSDETIAMLEYLISEKERLTETEAREVAELYRDYDRTRRIPKDEYVAYQSLIAQGDTIWHEAKEKSDFALFLPCLEKIFESLRRICLYIEPDRDPYDTALDTYERGLDSAACDRFFASLRKSLVPLIASVENARQIDDTPLHFFFPAAGQRELSSYLMDIMGIDRDSCIIGETEHPFTTNFTKRDVRITTHYFENDFASSMYSVIHEGGHALYELGTADELMYTCLGTGVSMAVHESQSRFYENIIGRSREFCTLIFPRVRALAGGALDNVDAEGFYRMINRSEPSLIRTEADELTYPLHIMVRYELERAVFRGDIRVSDLPHEWNRLYKEYLGISVPDDRRGVLQDSHWSNGNIGYFPSYALGSAYGPQFLREMNKSFDTSAAVASGNIGKINSWNREHIWKYGCMLDPSVLFSKVCGELNPELYVSYLTEKYKDIYDL